MAVPKATLKAARMVDRTADQTVSDLVAQMAVKSAAKTVGSSEWMWAATTAVWSEEPRAANWAGRWVEKTEILTAARSAILMVGHWGGTTVDRRAVM